MTRYTPLWVQQGNYAAQVDRGLINAIWPVQSYVSNMKPSPGGAPMIVNVATGKAVVFINIIGSVLCYSNALEAVVLTAAHATLDRIDLVVVQVRANDLDGGTNNDWVVQAVAGTPAASPVAPAVPAYAVAIAQVLIPAGFSALIPAANITDIRPRRLDQPWNTAWGEVAHVPATAAHNGIGATLTDVTGLSVTWDSPGNRTYLVTAAIPNVAQLTANGTQLFQLTDAANVVLTNAYAPAMFTPPNTSNAFVQGRVAGASKQTFTRKLRANTSGGTMNLVMSSAVPGWIRVDDTGPMAGTAGTLLDELSDRMEDTMTPTEPNEPNEPEPGPDSPPEPEPTAP